MSQHHGGKRMFHICGCVGPAYLQNVYSFHMQATSSLPSPLENGRAAPQKLAWRVGAWRAHGLNKSQCSQFLCPLGHRVEITTQSVLSSFCQLMKPFYVLLPPFSSTYYPPPSSLNSGLSQHARIMNVFS